MSVTGHDSVRPSRRATLAHVWQTAGTAARVLIVAWAVLPLVVVYGLVRLPWEAPGTVFTEVDPSYVMQQHARAFDDDAKADAGTLGAFMEGCFARTRSFAACDTAAELPQAVTAGIEFGTGQNKVEVAGASAEAYELVAVSQTGARYVLARSASGRLEHRCPDKGIGGCSPQGTW